MGRRARSRSAAAGSDAPRAPATPPPTATAARREGAFDRLSPARRVLARYLGCALVIAVATVVGIASLGGTLGPWIVLGGVVLGAGLTFRWAQRNLTGVSMGDEDRVIQTMAGGMLVISVGLALVSAVLLGLR